MNQKKKSALRKFINDFRNFRTVKKLKSDWKRL